MDRTFNTSLQGTTSDWSSQVLRSGQTLEPDYGYSASYAGALRMFSYGDGFYAISPKGINNLTFTLSLNYSNLHGDEAKRLIDFLEASKGLNFPFVPPDPFCKRNIFRCTGFSHTFTKNDLHNISVNLITNKQSSLNIEGVVSRNQFDFDEATENHTMYLSIYSADKTKYKFSITAISGGDVIHKGFRPTVGPLNYQTLSAYSRIGYKDYLKAAHTGDLSFSSDAIDGLSDPGYKLKGLIDYSNQNIDPRTTAGNFHRYTEFPSFSTESSMLFEVRVVPWTQSFGYSEYDTPLYSAGTSNFLSQWAYPKDIVVFYGSDNSSFDKYFYCKRNHFANANQSSYNRWAGGGTLSAGDVHTDLQKFPSHEDEIYWSKNFFWDPSFTTSISQASRIVSKVFDNEKVEVISDGKNVNPLVFDVSFNNRDDREAYAILHFLENRKGYVRFKWESVPEMYNRDGVDRYFICNQWSFSKRYIDNNSIKATFIEDPLGSDLGY